MKYILGYTVHKEPYNNLEIFACKRNGLEVLFREHLFYFMRLRIKEHFIVD